MLLLAQKHTHFPKMGLKFGQILDKLRNNAKDC